ncbi:hypothetical protein [Ruminiclostridium papyrosolvens]|uniref:Tetratricopeptide repeat protein n=1 Tax=Ruminiclostridium papyrosolvens C7 TaxID=1330534 RepID=U4QXH2_9FIRM|nr:hypothetical protein [Ruminiclostridium papyrosolvens]EPR07700.1 hypothetical protein L323_19265 [Ruminiclostridium papyrosolvens C7]
MTNSIMAAATILITALLAFYYLYKSRELDLGTLTSVSIGAVILGITFNPAYNTVFGYMERFNNINRDVEFLFFLVIASLFFLILVFTISILVSVFLPDRLSSINCSLVIERFFGRTKSHFKPEISENKTPEVSENDESREDLSVEEECELISAIEETVACEDVLEDTLKEEVSEDKHEPVNESEILVLKAFDCKVKGQKEQAVQYYTKALDYGNLSNDMVFWVVLDICALYKELGLNELACSILNSVAKRYGNELKPEIRAEIIKNLK